MWGPPGIGKTHIVLQVLKALPYTSVTLHATITPGKIAQRLPRASDLPSWAKATLSRLAQGQSSNQQDTVDALAALLAAQAPIVLHVEDLHEAEGEALALWVALSKAVRRSSGVGLIVTSRQEPPDAFTVQQSPPLTLGDAVLKVKPQHELDRTVSGASALRRRFSETLPCKRLQQLSCAFLPEPVVQRRL